MGDPKRDIQKREQIPVHWEESRFQKMGVKGRFGGLQEAGATKVGGGLLSV